MSVRFESDWLGTVPCFYHERTGRVSTRIHEVIDYRNLEWDADALIDYLDFGYSAFGRTPVRHVRFVPPCTRLVVEADTRLREEALPDPVDRWASRTSRVDEAVDILRDTIARWEITCANGIVLPLSGGYDSRLLGLLTRDKARLRAFSYGISPDQSKSREITRARLVAERLGVPWEQVELRDFHGRIDDWEEMFGISTHAHGMYHLEFYDRIAARTGSEFALLSGMIGDAWAGSLPRLPAASADDLPVLGLSRGHHAESQHCRLRGDGRYRQEFWARRRERFQDPVFQVVEVLRQKMILLAFILSVPRKFGFAAWTPFVVPEVALTMTTLPPELRAGRRWQRELFARNQLNVENEAGGSRQNTLDLKAVQLHPPAPLDVGLLSELFPREYLERINREVLQPGFVARQWAFANGHPVVGRIAGRLHAPNPHQSAYASFLVLKPLESLIRRRNAA